MYLRGIFVCISFIISIHLNSQTCTGNLGENIFTDGDFGSGTANILLPDPKIAPGYNYASNSYPPQDGYYIITNSTNWPTLFPTWLNIKDNSNDPNGYFMVINASFSPGIFYEKTVTGLCDNTLYEFSADVINMIKIPVTGHILPNVSFLLDDDVKFTTGAIPQSERWNKAGFTFTTKPGQFDLKLTLKNNAPGGNGNDLAIDNISFRACGPKALILPETVANICENGSPIDLKATIDGDQFRNPAIQWQVSPDGQNNWQNLGKDSIQKHTDLRSGYYYYRYLLAGSESSLANAKCRLVSNVKVIFVQPKLYTINDTICGGNEYSFGKRKFKNAGTYIDSLKSSIGCDSIVTLRLVVLPDKGITADKIIIPPSCYLYKDASLTIATVNNAYSPVIVSLDNKSINGNTKFEQLSGGKYSLKVVDHFGCMLNEPIEIIDPMIFSVDLGQERTINLGTEIELKAASSEPFTSSRYTYEHQIICDQACEGKRYIPFTSSRLKVDATTAKGCMATDSILLTVKEDVNLFVPNVFTPNGDGKNDVFIPYTTNNVVKEIISFDVFNRFGGLIYHAEKLEPRDVQIGWDGTVKSKAADQDIYVYIIKLLLINDKVINRSGDVLLLR